MNLLENLLGSRVRAMLIELFWSSPGKKYYLRELERETGLAIRSIQVEVKKLADMDLIEAEKDGNRINYSAKTAHPLSTVLSQLVQKTVGVVPRLKTALEKFDIDIAFIFGSIARREERARSDVDLFIIGKIGLRELAPLLNKISSDVSREINPHVMSLETFQKKVKAKDHFITSILKGKKQMLIGDTNVLKQVV